MQIPEQLAYLSLLLNFISHAKFPPHIYSDFSTAILPYFVWSQVTIAAKLRNTAILWSQERAESKAILPLQFIYNLYILYVYKDIQEELRFSFSKP